MKGIDKKIFLMDGGSIRWDGPEGFGTALGQLQAELRECGIVVPARDLAPDDLPASATPCDFVVLRHGLWRWGYVTVRLEVSGGSYLVSFQASVRNVSTRLLESIRTRLNPPC